MRRMVLTAAKAMDELGNAEARVWVSAVKAMVPIRVCEIIDEAIQVHGASGCLAVDAAGAGCTPRQRTLRLADGPDEVHWHVVGRAELASWEPSAEGYDPKVAYYTNAGAGGDYGPSSPGHKRWSFVRSGRPTTEEDELASGPVGSVANLDQLESFFDRTSPRSRIENGSATWRSTPARGRHRGTQSSTER